MDSELRSYLEGMESRIFDRMIGLQTESESRMVAKMVALQSETELRLSDKMHVMQVETESHLTEKMRDMPTELLRGFESFSSGSTIRMRKLEADQSNLDASMRARVEIVEARLSQIEQRLGKQ